jgi:hypothetical protein
MESIFLWAICNRECDGSPAPGSPRVSPTLNQVGSGEFCNHDGNRTSSNFNLPFAPFSRFDSANPSGVRKTEIFSI